MFQYLSNIQRSLDLLLINCEIELDFWFWQDCVNFKIPRTTEIPANPAGSPCTGCVLQTLVTGATFQINSTKLFVPVVTLSINYAIKFLENLKQGFKRTISWNKYRSEVATQTKNNNYMIEPTLRNINGLFVLSFRLRRSMPARNTFNRHYLPFVEVKDFNVLINNKSFFDQPIKTNKMHKKNLLKCQEMITIHQETD